jgi:hypothetical protein
MANRGKAKLYFQVIWYGLGAVLVLYLIRGYLHSVVL